MCYIVEKLHRIKIEIILSQIQNFVSKNMYVFQALASLGIQIQSL